LGQDNLGAKFAGGTFRNTEKVFEFRLRVPLHSLGKVARDGYRSAVNLVLEGKIPSIFKASVNL